MAESKTIIYGALAANSAIAVTKFIVAGITGSSAMISEGIHSAVDTGNALLLLVGTKLSERPPSEQHPFGHGKELYFWGLIVAVLIFGIGGGVSFYEGVMHMRHPAPLENPFWNYVVLGAAACFEGVSFGIALKAFLKEAGDRPFWDALHGSKDPVTYTVLAEDAAAMLGPRRGRARRLGQPPLEHAGARRRGVDRHRAAARRRGGAAGLRVARAAHRRGPAARDRGRDPPHGAAGTTASSTSAGRCRCTSAARRCC